MTNFRQSRQNDLKRFSATHFCVCDWLGFFGQDAWIKNSLLVPFFFAFYIPIVSFLYKESPYYLPKISSWINFSFRCNNDVSALELGRINFWLANSVGKLSEYYDDKILRLLISVTKYDSSCRNHLQTYYRTGPGYENFAVGNSPTRKDGDRGSVVNRFVWTHFITVLSQNEPKKSCHRTRKRWWRCWTK